MLTQRIHANGVVLHVETFGHPGDPPVLLMMGAMSSGGWWPDGFCKGLADRGRYVIRYDHRDTGQSTMGAPGSLNYTVVDLAEDAFGILDALAIQSIHLVGMSLGGYLAQIMVLAHPARVQTLTLIASEPLRPADPELPSMNPELAAYHAKASELDWGKREAVVDYQVGAWRLLSGSAHAFDEASIRAIAEREFDRTPDMRAAFNHAALGGGELYLNRLNEIGAPALIIHGTEDPVLPYAHALSLKAALKAARLLPLQGTGHELHPADWKTMLDAIEQHTAAVS